MLLGASGTLNHSLSSAVVQLQCAEDITNCSIFLLYSAMVNVNSARVYRFCFQWW